MDRRESWLKLHRSITLSRKVFSLTDKEHRLWINLLCLAREEDGAIPPAQDVAFILRLPDDLTVSLIDSLVAKQFLDVSGTGETHMHDWGEWNPRKPTSTERVREHRERNRKAAPSPAETILEQDETRDTHETRETVSPCSGAFQAFRGNTIETRGTRETTIEEKRLEENRSPPYPPQVSESPPRQNGAGRSAPDAADTVDAAQWRAYLQVFAGCGLGLNEADQAKALRLWISRTPPDRGLALADAQTRAMTSWRTPDLTAMPANHLRDAPWTRKPAIRTLPRAPDRNGKPMASAASAVEAMKAVLERDLEREEKHAADK